MARWCCLIYRPSLVVIFALAVSAFGEQPGQLAHVDLSVSSALPLTSSVQTSATIAAPPSLSAHDHFVNRLWLTSAIAMLGATAADAGTSWSYNEGNGILASHNGSFGARGLGIKMGTAGGLLVPQYLLRHHKDFRSKFIAANFAEAGIFGVTAIHNVRLVNSLK